MDRSEIETSIEDLRDRVRSLEIQVEGLMDRVRELEREQPDRST